MQAKRWYANPLVENNLGKFAVSRGPLVYCLEEVDNWKESSSFVSWKKQEELKYEFDEAMLGGVGVITASGWKTEADSGQNGFNRKNTAAEKKNKDENQMDSLLQLGQQR